MNGKDKPDKPDKPRGNAKATTGDGKEHNLVPVANNPYRWECDEGDGVYVEAIPSS